MNIFTSLIRKSLANLGTGVGIALGMVLTFAVVSAFQSPGGTPSSAGFQSSGAAMLTTASGQTFDRTTMSLQAIRTKLDAIASSSGEIKGGVYGSYTVYTTQNRCGVNWGVATCTSTWGGDCGTSGNYVPQVIDSDDISRTYVCIKK